MKISVIRYDYYRVFYYKGGFYEKNNFSTFSNSGNITNNSIYTCSNCLKYGLSFAEGSYHLITHALLVALIFTVIFCTITIIEALNKDKEKSDADKKEL